MKERLGSSTVIILPTDKTESFVVMKTRQYIKKVERHIKKLAKEIDRGKLADIEKKGPEILNFITLHLDKGEL